MLVPVFRPGRRVTRAARARLEPVAWCEVDDDRQDLLAYNWRLSQYGYAQRTDPATNRAIFLHHLILPKRVGLDVSHEDGNRLNCRSGNLCYRTRSGNRLNPRDDLQDNNTSGIRGVTQDASRPRPWRGQVRLNGRHHVTRWCDTAIEAALALNAMRVALGVEPDHRVVEATHGIA